MNNVVVFTVIYPSALVYLNDFQICLRQQTFQNFDLLIVNEGCDKNLICDALSGFNITILESHYTPVKNREIGIFEAFRMKYKYLIFCDIDDWFASTRFEISIKGLLDTDIVVNDLNIVDDNRKMLDCNYFSHSIDSSVKIDKDFLKEKNILGLSNTAIRLQDKLMVSFPENLSICDWYYYTICAERNANFKYINLALTDYRQHSGNLIGIDAFSVELFKKMIKFKIEHYHFLSKIYPQYIELYLETKELSNKDDDSIIAIINKNKLISSRPLWWEIVKC